MEKPDSKVIEKECKILLKNSAVYNWMELQKGSPFIILETTLDVRTFIDNISKIVKNRKNRIFIIELIEQSETFRKEIARDSTACSYFIDTLLSCVSEDDWKIIEQFYEAERNTQKTEEKETTLLFHNEKFVLPENFKSKTYSAEKGRRNYKAYAVKKGKKIGYAEIEQSITGIAQLKSLFIEPHERNKKIGRQLMKFIIKKLKEGGCKKIILEATPSDLNAQQVNSAEARLEVQNKLFNFFEKKCNFIKIEPYNNNRMEYIIT